MSCRASADSGSAYRSNAVDAANSACFSGMRALSTPINRFARALERISPLQSGRSVSVAVSARYSVIEPMRNSKSSCIAFAFANSSGMCASGGRWSVPFIASTTGPGSNGARSDTMRRVRVISSSTVSGSATPFPYDVTRYAARTREPSGASQWNSVRSTARGTPRHTVASLKPQSRSSCGIWAM